MVIEMVFISLLASITLLNLIMTIFVAQKDVINNYKDLKEGLEKEIDLFIKNRQEKFDNEYEKAILNINTEALTYINKIQHYENKGNSNGKSKTKSKKISSK
jgi:hypothetical protein